MKANIAIKAAREAKKDGNRAIVIDGKLHFIRKVPLVAERCIRNEDAIIDPRGVAFDAPEGTVLTLY